MVIEIPGRSFQNEEVSRDELLTLTRAFEAGEFLFKKEMSDWLYDVRLVEGDLVVDGGLDMQEQDLAGLVVTGNLVVRGTYTDSDDPESGVFVLGDMEATNIVTAGWLNVGGSLLVHEGLVGDYNDCSATILGRTTARYLRTEQHWFSFGGDVRVGYTLGEPRGEWPATTTLNATPPSRYPDVLLPEVFSINDAKEPYDPAALDDEMRADLDDWLTVNHRELIRRILNDAPVLR